MSKKVDLALRELLINNYGHYSREYEKSLLSQILLADEDITAGMIKKSGDSLEKLGAYDYPLADDNLRSTKNGFICLVAVICREAADLGADSIKSFALSDYFINRIEKELTLVNWPELLTDIVENYRKLVRQGRERPYSKPVKAAITYINNNLYERISLSDVAANTGLSKEYLSSLFKKETGENVSTFINRSKTEEAAKLLAEGNRSISEVSDLLGYSDLSYFSKVFAKHFGYPPSKI